MPKRPFDKYFIALDEAEAAKAHFPSFDDFYRRPTDAFVRQVVETSDAVKKCRTDFVKKKDGTLNKNSLDSIRVINAAAHTSMMGYLEIFQRHLFAGLFEASRLLPSFDVRGLLKRLDVRGNEVSVGPEALAAYRGQLAPLGQIVADALPRWSDPVCVNKYLKAFAPRDFYSEDVVKELRLFWQLRHSIAHTGGWITHPDAQKVKALHTYGGTQIVLDERFTVQAARKLCEWVSGAVEPYAVAFLEAAEAGADGSRPDHVDEGEWAEVQALFDISHTRRSWISGSQATPSSDDL